MQALVDTVTAVVNAAVGWIGQYASSITSSPILTMAVVAVPLCGLGVGLLSRLLRKRV